MPPKCRSDIIFSLNDCRMILISCCLAEKLQNVKKNVFLFLAGGGGGQDKPAWTACPPGVKITRVGARYPGTACPPGGKPTAVSLPPGGQAVQGAR